MTFVNNYFVPPLGWVHYSQSAFLTVRGRLLISSPNNEAGVLLTKTETSSRVDCYAVPPHDRSVQLPRVGKSWKEAIDQTLAALLAERSRRNSNVSFGAPIKLRLFVSPEDCMALGAEVMDEFDDTSGLQSLMSGVGVAYHSVDYICDDQGVLKLNSSLRNNDMFGEIARSLDEKRFSYHVALARPSGAAIDQSNDKYLKELFSQMFRNLKITIDSSQIWPFIQSFLDKVKNKKDVELPTPPALPELWITLDDEGRITGHIIKVGLATVRGTFRDNGFPVGAVAVRVKYQQYMPLAYPLESQHTRVWEMQSDHLNALQSVAMKNLLLRWDQRPPSHPQGWAVTAISQKKVK
ncbi:MAG: hypothetical protein IPJ69_06510 [Deltaproteobacteria bacterium]|nr:MAG: hypothetical protein IPJ69_06510 [Deltaproteobacteria bacterium]